MYLVHFVAKTEFTKCIDLYVTLNCYRCNEYNTLRRQFESLDQNTIRNRSSLLDMIATINNLLGQIQPTSGSSAGTPQPAAQGEHDPESALDLSSASPQQQPSARAQGEQAN